jgi:ABC-2 type transport system ATP-binding protein
MSNALCIDVRDVTYRYRHADNDALSGIDMSVERGSIFGLLGPNGAGKSTLLSLLSGSLAVQQGSIAIADAKTPREIKAISAIVPQEYAFYEDLSGQENLDYFAGVCGLSKQRAAQRIEACVAMCRLSEFLSRRAGHYSGGLKRRLNLAIGLLNEPQILYLDEPTVGIDAESRQFIVEAIHNLRSTGITIIYTSHYMEEVERLCDAIVVIDRGRVVAREKMESLLQRDGGRALHLRLKEPAPQLADALAMYRAEHTEFRNWHLELPADQLPALLSELARHGAHIERLQYGISRLEKIYLQLLTHDSPVETQP